jgi:outer membrane protein
MIRRLLHSAVALLVAAMVVTAPVAPAYGQQQSSSKPDNSQNAAQPQLPSYRLAISDYDYSKGRRLFPNVLGPYRPIEVPRPDLTNSPKIEQLIHEGKMELSLQDAIALALENNLDISIQRYTPWIAETDILRTLSGGAARGLAGTGTASVLGAIPVETFDPLVTSSLSVDHRHTPVNNPFLSGTGLATLSSLTNHTITGNFSYSQAFHTGTGMAVTWNNNRASTTSPAVLFNPALNSNLFVSFTQQLLNGFGLLPNTRFIRIAKNNKRIADYQFSQQAITSVVQVANQYWELVFARADVLVQQRAVEVAEKLYSDNKRQVEIGTLAPIEVVRAEAEVARNRQNLIVSQTNQLQQQTLLKNLITKDPLAANLQEVEIIPTDKPVQQPPIDIPPLPDAVKEALEKRPDILQQRVDLLNREINVRATSNALLPVLSLFGQYGWTGLAGNSRVLGLPTGAFTPNLNSPVVTASGTPTGNFTSNTVLGPSTFVTGGLNDAFDAILNNNFPTYTLQLSLSIPIRNRSAQADSARARLEQRQSQTTLQRLQNNVVVEVRNAEIALEQNRARVEAATKGRILQEQTLDAEQKKFQLGASTIFFVIQAQRDLATAQDAEVRALVDLLKSEIDFERALGRILEVNHITIADAKGGRVQRDTLIPGTVSGEVIGTRQTY